MDVFRVLEPGFGMTFQDRGRRGWRRFGVPPGGAMDDHAAAWANRLLQNPPQAALIEFSLQGARLEALDEVWIALTGATAGSQIPLWETVRVRKGDHLEFPRNRRGVWSYLAVEGGFQAPRRFGSVSVYARGGLGIPCQAGDCLRRAGPGHPAAWEGIARRIVSPAERRDYNAPPGLRVWPGPQWDWFSENDQSLFFAQEYVVSARSDRAGYRVEAAPLNLPAREMISEPVQTGSVQLPPNGQPIITMRDGPTLGGYPKIGLLDPEDLSWLAQCRPGQPIRFVPHQP